MEQGCSVQGLLYQVGATVWNAVDGTVCGGPVLFAVAHGAANRCGISRHGSHSDKSKDPSYSWGVKHGRFGRTSKFGTPTVSIIHDLDGVSLGLLFTWMLGSRRPDSQFGARTEKVRQDDGDGDVVGGERSVGVGGERSVGVRMSESKILLPRSRSRYYRRTSRESGRPLFFIPHVNKTLDKQVLRNGDIRVNTEYVQVNPNAQQF